MLIFLEIIFHLWWLLPLILLVSIVKTPWFKGRLGEWVVRLSAKFFLDPETYHPIHDVTLSTPDGTTQIDHIFVSRYGIFVVETKNYSGWIFGGSEQSTWTQKIFKKSTKFQNPLRQNFKHVKALENMLGVSSDKIHSVIVFVGDGEFKTKMPPNVTYTGGYIDYIKSKKDVLFSDADVSELRNAILTSRMTPSFATHQTHVQNVKRRLDPAIPRTCPKCGSPMILRTTARGDNSGNKFWGCSAFPRCRVTQNIT